MKTDTSKRQLLKLATMAPLAGLTALAAGHEVKVVELDPQKKYVFRLLHAEGLEEADLQAIKTHLQDEGFHNVLVVTDQIEIYELPN